MNKWSTTQIVFLDRELKIRCIGNANIFAVNDDITYKYESGMRFIINEMQYQK